MGNVSEGVRGNCKKKGISGTFARLLYLVIQRAWVCMWLSADTGVMRLWSYGKSESGLGVF